MVVVVVVWTALAGCGGDEGRAKPKAGKQVVVARFPPEFIPRGVAVDGTGTVYTSGWDGKRFVLAAFPKKGKPTRRPIPCATSKGFDAGLYGSLVVTPDGTLFWALTDQYRVVRINPDGSGDCYAGTGERGFSGDGSPAISARLSTVTALGYDPERQDLYVADNDRVRRIDAAGTISTAVEPAGLAGSSLGSPINMTFDARRGRLYVKGREGIAYRTRDGEEKLVPRSDAPGFPSHGLAADPTGGDLVTTRIRECDVVRIRDDGTVQTVSGGYFRVDDGVVKPVPRTGVYCSFQSAVDDQGDIWLVTSSELVVAHPGR